MTYRDDPLWIADANGCHVWQRAISTDGYGSRWHAGRVQGAHRVAYEEAFGLLPAGVQLDHLCHDPRTCAGGPTCPHRRCVNPAHLAPTTTAGNTRRGALAKLTSEAAAEIRRRAAEGETHEALGATFGVSRRRVGQIAAGDGWS